MKAWLLRNPGPIESRPLEYAELDPPVPGVGELVVKVAACGICRTDLHVTEGELPSRLNPVTPGHQIVGTVVATGDQVSGLRLGQRVGIAWLHSTCGRCRDCLANRENLCENAEFTGWTRNGGFAEYVAAKADFVYPLPEGLDELQAAPLLCAGIIGYRALKLTQLEDWQGARIGIYGFGAAGHICIQLARSQGADVFVATRDRVKHRALAEELGAVWVGDTFDEPPEKLDAAVIFAPAGEIVPAALGALRKGGRLVLGGIHMSRIPEIDYALIYGERSITSVANNVRQDGYDFLKQAAAIPIKTTVEAFPMGRADDALIALKNDSIKGAGVLINE